MPSPPWRRVVDVSAWLKRSKTRGRNSGIDAGPGVRHVDPRHSVGSGNLYPDRTGFRRELHGVRKQIDGDLM